MQRHSAPFIPSPIGASVGCGFLSSSALALMICPFWQKPHCGTCSSIHACCRGWSLPPLAIPSSVVISPLTVEVGVIQERVATPFMMTVHAPHWPSPQPNRGPCKPRSLRRMYSSGVDGATSTVCALPFTFSAMLLILPFSSNWCVWAICPILSDSRCGYCSLHEKFAASFVLPTPLY